MYQEDVGSVVFQYVRYVHQKLNDFKRATDIMISKQVVLLSNGRKANYSLHFKSLDLFKFPVTLVKGKKR